jgi:predicted nucleic acid-binding protein
VILIDANVFMYAAGRASPFRVPCQRFLERTVAGGLLDIVISSL